MTRIVRQLRGGQITIPADYRRRLGITDDSLLQMSIEPGELRIKPVRVTEQAESDWIKELYDLFTPVRTQAKGQSEEDINTAIDDAVHAVRKGHVLGMLEDEATPKAMRVDKRPDEDNRIEDHNRIITKEETPQGQDCSRPPRRTRPRS